MFISSLLCPSAGKYIFDFFVLIFKFGLKNMFFFGGLDDFCMFLDVFSVSSCELMLILRPNN